MQLAKRCRWVIMLLIILSFSVQGMANVSIVRQPAELILPETNQNQATNSIEAAYSGSVRIHIMEPVSRWNDYDGHAYDNAHIWYPLIASFSVGDLSTWDTTITFIGDDHNATLNTSVDNIAAVGVIFNSEYEVNDAYPPNGYWFTSYYADASATAKPGVPGRNMTPAGFTHSVYLEEGTATT